MINGKQKKAILIFGYGRFGRHLATKQQELGNEVMVIDKNEQVIQDASMDIENAMVGDCTNKNIINSLGVRNYDICFITFGEDFEASITVTSLLKAAGASRVVTRAGSSMQEELLKKIGADEIVYPERDFAEKIALHSNLTNVYNFLELTHDCSIFEISVPIKWVGKSISELDIRKRHKITALIVGNKEGVSSLVSTSYVFQQDDRLIVMAKDKDFIRFTHESDKK